MIILAALALAKIDDLPYGIIRFTGFAGVHRNFRDVRQELSNIPNSILTQPLILDNGTLVMVDGGETLALFEASYHPMKIYLAKRSLMRMFLDNGQDMVYKFSKIPFTAHDELTDSIRRNHPSCWLPRDLRMNITLSLRTEVKLKARSLFVGVPLPVPAYTNSAQVTKYLEAEPTQQMDNENTMRNATKDSELRQFAEVKLYVEKYQGYATFYPAQRRLLDKFELWRQEQDVELDNTIRKALMSDKAWTSCAAISQSKTYAEMEKISPETAANLLKSVLKQSLREGYSNNTEAMKADFIKAPLAHSFTFKISFCLPDNSIGTIDYPAG
jgi:hypothetical protein